MFDVKQFYNDENEIILKDYEKVILRIKEIYEETEKNEDKFLKFFHNISIKIIKSYEYEKVLNDDYIYSNDFQVLLIKNNEFFKEVLYENYNRSYANPEHCVNIFDETLGPLFSYFYSKFTGITSEIVKHKKFKIIELNSVFLEAYDYIKNNKIDFNEIKNIMVKVDRKKDKTKDCYFEFAEQYNEDYRFYTDIIDFSLLNDTRYLFKYGKYISDNEIKTAKFLLNYPLDKIKKIASSVFNAYIEGFKRDNKIIDKRRTVCFQLNIGQEHIFKYLFELFLDNNFKIAVKEMAASAVNHQYNYDHKFDSSLYLNEKYASDSIQSFKNALELNDEVLQKISGTVYFEKFGEEPYIPINKRSNLKLNDVQIKLYSKIKSEMNRIFNQFVPGNETSFCIIAFPTHEIGKHFKDIFDETFLINTLDNSKYQKINQIIIDALDKASFIHVKGSNKNETDFIIKLNDIDDPENQTNFVNSTASVNIPVGEVFTSPRLTGTNGILNVKNSYLEDYNFKDLKLKFKDGYIEEYSCNNYKNPEDNKKYIRDNLLFPHETLPLGEFAIGTNTLAYKMCRNYNILNKLPVLIIEKMGPHFAIGDTCFKHREENKTYNLLNKKEFIAKDNEKTILRKKDIDKAYTDVHIDITLPYNEIDFIKAVTKENKEIIIIKDGKFVLEGTKELNIYL